VRAGHLGTQLPAGRMELSRRARWHAREHRLEPLAWLGSQAAVQRRPLLPFPQVLGLLRRHCHRFVLSQPGTDSLSDGRSVSRAGERPRRDICSQGPAGPRHLLHDYRVPELLYRYVGFDGQCRDGAVSQAGYLRAQGHAGFGSQPGADLSGERSPNSGSRVAGPADPHASRRTFALPPQGPQPTPHAAHDEFLCLCAIRASSPTRTAEIGHQIITAIKLRRTMRIAKARRSYLTLPRSAWSRRLPHGPYTRATARTTPRRNWLHRSFELTRPESVKGEYPLETHRGLFVFSGLPVQRKEYRDRGCQHAARPRPGSIWGPC
jgi:hypothetical protein